MVTNRCHPEPVEVLTVTTYRALTYELLSKSVSEIVNFTILNTV